MPRELISNLILCTFLFIQHEVFGVPLDNIDYRSRHEVRSSNNDPKPITVSSSTSSGSQQHNVESTRDLAPVNDSYTSDTPVDNTPVDDDYDDDALVRLMEEAEERHRVQMSEKSVVLTDTDKSSEIPDICDNATTLVAIDHIGDLLDHSSSQNNSSLNQEDEILSSQINISSSQSLEFEDLINDPNMADNEQLDNVNEYSQDYSQECSQDFSQESVDDEN